MDLKLYTTDVLIIGGGTAGCAAAIRLKESGLRVIVAEKAGIVRSGCLAGGLNTLKAYISKGHVPQDYVRYATEFADGIAREDLLISISKRLNHVTYELEAAGLPIIKDSLGRYISTNWRSLKVNGENIKPLIAGQVLKCPLTEVINHINITDFIVKDSRIYGACGFMVDRPEAVEIYAEAVLIATGGAAGMYLPYAPGFSRHKIWYPPFNTGAGLAMGIRCGAEMTTFEMRYTALICKGTSAPADTLISECAQQLNSVDIVDMDTRYLKTSGISRDTEEDLYKAYLNASPQQTLKWLSGHNPSKYNVETDRSDPYIVGGHTGSGYWINIDRSTTITGLYAAGDIAGGAPQKYATGALAEGEIAAEGILSFMIDNKNIRMPHPHTVDTFIDSIIRRYDSFYNNPGIAYSTDELEEAMQNVMDEYAGGRSTDYRFNNTGLEIADERIREITQMSDNLRATDNYSLMKIYELRERLLICRVLIAHMKARKETRWPAFNIRSDFTEKREKYGQVFVNSVYSDGKIQIKYRRVRHSEDSSR